MKPNGAKVKIVSGGADITGYLNVSAADGNGVVDLAKATVKEEIVKETLDVERGGQSLIFVAARKGLRALPSRRHRRGWGCSISFARVRRLKG